MLFYKKMKQSTQKKRNKQRYDLSSFRIGPEFWLDNNNTRTFLEILTFNLHCKETRLDVGLLHILAQKVEYMALKTIRNPNECHFWQQVLIVVVDVY